MKLNKLLSIIISSVIAFTASFTFHSSFEETISFTAAAADDTEQTYDSWQEAYRAKLIDFMYNDKYYQQYTGEQFNDYSMFDIYDVNEDGIPELFISQGGSYASGVCEVYSYINGKCELLTKTSQDFGNTIINLSQNLICDTGGIQGVYHYYYYKFDENELTLIDSFNCSESSNEYYHNDQAISKEEFNNAIAIYESL